MKCSTGKFEKSFFSILNRKIKTNFIYFVNFLTVNLNIDFNSEKIWKVFLQVIKINIKTKSDNKFVFLTTNF